MEPPRSLIVTADSRLLDELLRLTSAAGVLPVVAPDSVAAKTLWANASLIVVGADQAAACANAGLRRQNQLILVADTEPDDPLWGLAARLDAEHVAVLPAAEPWLIDRFEHSELAGTSARMVGVIGGRGGAGASVLAAGLAVTAASQGERVLLVDADPLGGGVDLVLGWEDLGGARWPELCEGEPDDFPTRGRLSVLSQDRHEPVRVTKKLMDTALRTGGADRDLIVLDLPRNLDEAARMTLREADRLLLVVPAELRACAAAAKVVSHAQIQEPVMELIVRGPAPGRLQAKEIARALDLPLAGTLRTEPRLATALERGLAPARTGKGPLAELCRLLLADPRLARQRGTHE